MEMIARILLATVLLFPLSALLYVLMVLFQVSLSFLGAALIARSSSKQKGSFQDRFVLAFVILLFPL